MQKTRLKQKRKTKKKEELKLDTSKRSSQALILTVSLSQIYHKSLDKRLATLN